MNNRRAVKIAVISDLHLGTFGCQSLSIISYLRSIQPEILILNGDIIDVWQFSKRYFPGSHMQVIEEVLHFISTGTKVYYLTGNHDEAFRRYSDLKIGNLILTDHLVLDIAGKKTWIFHGDIFDATTKGWAKIIAKLGGKGYDLLILLNQAINACLTFFGSEKMSFSKKVKNGVKQAVTFIQNFESTAIELAAEQGYDTVICGHIHQPQKKIHSVKGRNIEYLNSGDWVENCTALEWNDGWNIHTHIENNPSNLRLDFVKSNKHKDLIHKTTLLFNH